MNIYKGFYSSPLGNICIESYNDSITGLNFIEDKSNYKENLNNTILKCRSELDEYFCGKRKVFEINITLNGTEFRKKVWNKLLEIPYGQVRTYKDIAMLIGNDKSVRAVGGANHHNNIAIIIPCHRVLGSNGKLVGYAGGIWRKEWLINHELKNI